MGVIFLDAMNAGPISASCTNDTTVSMILHSTMVGALRGGLGKLASTGNWIFAEEGIRAHP